MKIASITLFSLVQFIRVTSWCKDTDKRLLDGWKGHSGALYNFFTLQAPINYTDWEKFCQTYGGDLTTAKTAEENDFVYSLISIYGGQTFLGLKTDGVKWIWNDGTPLIYSNWSTASDAYTFGACPYFTASFWWYRVNCYALIGYGVCKCPIGLNGLNSSCNTSTGCSDPYAECMAIISGATNTCQCKINNTDIGGICKAGLNSSCSTTIGCSDPYAECTSIISGGTNTCQCKINYTGIGGICKAGLNSSCSTTIGCSDTYAECKAIISGGAKTCQCQISYTGIGGICKAGLNSVCTTSNGCSDPYAECMTNVSGVINTCQCKSNYINDGGICKTVTVDSISITRDTYNGRVVNVTCLTNIAANVTPTFRWTYNGNEINPVAGSRISILNISIDANVSNRINITVLFNPIQSSDTGTYECIATAQNTPSSSMNISVDVLTQPAVSIQPLTQTVDAEATVNITCTIVNNVKITRMVWYRNGTSFNASSTFPDESLSNISTIYILTRRNITSGTVYECQGENEAGLGEKRQSNIYVILPGVVTCNNETDKRETHWARTLQGTNDKKLCPTGMSGYAVRYCSSDGVWRDASYDNCVNETLLQLLTLTDNMKNGLAPNTLSDSLLKLASVTNITDVHVDLQKREVEIVTDVLNNVIQISDNNNSITRSDIENFLEVASNMIDVKNSRSWKTIIDEGKDGASTIFRSVEQFGSIKARLTSSDNESVIINKMNLFVKIVSMPVSDIKFTDPTANGSFMERDIRSRLFLSNASLIKGNFTYYVAAYFRNVSQIVHTNVLDNNATLSATHDQEINSDVISLQLDPLPRNLSQPLIITFKHLSENYSNPVCSFLRNDVNGNGKGAWSSEGCTRLSTSDDTTVCECNHLTNFAILMSHGRTPPKDQVPLILISSIGCAISIFCLSVTMIIHIIVWRYVKSGRTSILMNLCLALTISYSIFLAGADQTENKNICLAVAALLHYFYLVVFFLMLAFGIEIAVTVVHVFASKSRVRWLLPLAWVLPAVTVGISLGLTKLNGYGNDNFCWLSIDDGLLWAFVGPAALVILVNFIILILVFKMMFSTSVMVNKSKKEKAKTSGRSLCVLLPITGLTWVFGILSVNEDMLIFQFVFAILNSLQGFFIFLFHCVFNHQLRNAIKQINDKRKRSQLPSPTSSKSNSNSAPPNHSNSSHEQKFYTAGDLEASEESIDTQFAECAREMLDTNKYKQGSVSNIEYRSTVDSNREVDGQQSDTLKHKKNVKHFKRTDTDVTLLPDDSSTSIAETGGIQSFRLLGPSNGSVLASTKMWTDETKAKNPTKPNRHLHDYQNPAFDESFLKPEY